MNTTNNIQKTLNFYNNTLLKNNFTEEDSDTLNDMKEKYNISEEDFNNTNISEYISDEVAGEIDIDWEDTDSIEYLKIMRFLIDSGSIFETDKPGIYLFQGDIINLKIASYFEI